MNPALIARLDSRDTDFESRFSDLLAWHTTDQTAVEQHVADIIAQVCHEGDAALIRLTHHYDKIALIPDGLAFSEAEIDAAFLDHGRRRGV